MRKQKSCKPLLYLLLTGWCFLFLRCESTEKSMVRAVYLAQTEQGYQAGLLYQAPQAAADAAEASAALQFVQAEGQTMERALAAAEQALRRRRDRAPDNTSHTAGRPDGTAKGCRAHRAPSVSAHRAGASACYPVERGRSDDTGRRRSAYCGS